MSTGFDLAIKKVVRERLARTGSVPAPSFHLKSKILAKADGARRTVAQPLHDGGGLAGGGADRLSNKERFRPIAGTITGPQRDGPSPLERGYCALDADAFTISS